MYLQQTSAYKLSNLSVINSALLPYTATQHHESCSVLDMKILACPYCSTEDVLQCLLAA
jgi:hypothetical protein